MLFLVLIFRNISIQNQKVLNEISFLFQASHFGSSSVALPGFAGLFKAAAKYKRKNAEKLVDYQTLRGGVVDIDDIPVSCMILSFFLFKYRTLFLMELGQE